MSKLIHLFFLSTITLVMSSCVPKVTEKKATCGTNEAFSNITRSCYSTVPANKAAVTSNIAPSSFVEDTQSIIYLSYSDYEIDLATQCQLTDLTNVTITQACTCDGLGVCSVGVTGTANYTGTASFLYSVKTNNTISSTAKATLTISAVNDAPTISDVSLLSLAALTTNEDTAKAVSVTVADVDSTLTCAGSVSVIANTNTVLVPNASIIISGSIPNCVATLTPAANLSGSGDITLRVTDGLLTNSTTFTFNVTSVNDAPSFTPSLIPAPTAVLEEAAAVVNFTLADVDTVLDCNSTYLSATISTSLLGLNTVVTFGGVYPNCTATITPGANYNGTANITITANDLTATATATTSPLPFVFTVTAVNDSPTMTAIVNPTIIENSVGAPTSGYVTTTVDAGGGGLETTQTLSMTATSVTATLIPNTPCTSYTPGAGIPATVPTVAEYYFDTTNKKCYVSNLLTTPHSWELYPSLTVIPNCSYDYSGLGVPVIAPSASGKHYLDTTNNKCYKSSGTTVASWALDAAVTSFTIAFVPVANQSGSSIINLALTDSGLTANGGSDTATPASFTANVTFVDNVPYFNSSITSVHTNEGGMVVAGPFKVDEDQGSSPDESLQDITIVSVASDNQSVLPDTAITAFYDLNDNGVEDALEARDIGAVGVGDILELVTLVDDSKAHNFYLKLNPIAGIAGNANITMTVSDGTNTTPTVFSLIVHPIAALHGGWADISAKGIKTDKAGKPAAFSDVQCNYNKSTDPYRCNGTQSCTGLDSPTAVVVPDAANVLYWDSANKKCYRSTGTTISSWVDFNSTCPLVRNTSCTGGNCISSSAPIPSAVGQFYYNTTTGCAISTGTALNTDWINYTPSKVNLTWNAFTVNGSGAEILVSIYGWNVYRREAGHDYDFVSGYLKTNSTDLMTITGASSRTYTDTTAVAGKVYYYLVRPVDNTSRKLTISTPEIYSEVRVLAPVENYAFVHRWMVNQEVCSSMHLTTQASHNFRCVYKGPGESSGYYDIGKDMLVDISESGCPYTAAPRCTSNGCIGNGDPTTLGITGVANDIFYDRSSGACYMSNGATWTDFGAADTATNLTATHVLKSNTALNAPLVNITPTNAANICSMRSTATATANLGIPNLATTNPPTSPSLPSKKEYIAYASAPYGMSDSNILNLEAGFSLNSVSRCNSSAANGIDNTFTETSIPSTSYIFSLPGSATSGIRSIYTGSVPWGLNYSTESCSSRYGVQDVYGNVAEWVTDSMTCDTSTKVCAANAGTDLGNYDFDTVAATGVTYGFDMVTGPYNDANADSLNDTVSVQEDAFLTDWLFRNSTFQSGKFSFPLGMPISTDIGAGASAISGSAALSYILAIGNTSGITANQLHEDGIIVNGALTTMISSAQATTIENATITLKANALTHYNNAVATVDYAELGTYPSAVSGDASTGDEYTAYQAAITAESSALAAYNAAVSAKAAATISKAAIAADPLSVATSTLVATTKSLVTTANTLAITASTNATAAKAAADLVLGPPDPGLVSDALTAKNSGLTIVTNGSTALAAVNVTVTGNGGFAVGGSYVSGTFAGRYTSELVPTAVTRDDIGFRCYIPIIKTDYPVSTDGGRHPYTSAY